MKAENPTQVLTAISAMQDLERTRALNRTRINTLFNGNPPYTSKEQDENNIQTNVNFLEAARMASDARHTFSNAFLKPGNFFNVTCDYGPPHKRSSYSRLITACLNKTLKRSLPYSEMMKAVIAQIVLHGVGPVLWQHRTRWLPTFLGIEDLLMPSRSLVSLENVTHFAVYREYTPQQLVDLTSGAPSNSGWNKSAVNALLKEATKHPTGNAQTDYYQFPEKLEEDWKSMSWYWGSDAVTTIRLWDFYFQEDKGESWHRRVVQEAGQNPANPDSQFVFNPGDRVYAKSINELIHIQFADGANVPPFRYHSVRSLGYLLYAVCNLMNRYRCQFMDRTFESMLVWFRNQLSPSGEKPELTNLHNYAILPEGVSVVPASERHSIDEGLASFAMNSLRQLMSENSASYTQDLEHSGNASETATKTMARVNSASAMIGAMLANAYDYQRYQYMEICRRFCQRHSGDKDIEYFQQKMFEEGVPREALDVQRWEIEPERVVGNGLKTLEIAQADRLMQVYPMLNPEAQQEALHIYVEANTDNPQLADRLVPPSRPLVTDASQEASFAMGPLMQGLPVGIRAGINHVDYLETMLPDLQKIIERAAQKGVPTEQELIGMVTISDHAKGHIQLLAQQDSEQQRVKAYGDILAKMDNDIRALAQRLAEQQQAQNGGMDPKTAAEVQKGMILTQSKAKQMEALTAQKIRLKDIAAEREQQRKDAKLHADISSKDLTTQADIIRENAATVQTLEEP